MRFKVFTIGLLALAVLSMAALANDGRILNIVDPNTGAGEHPWGGDNYNNNPIIPINYTPITPGIVPQGIFIRIAANHYWMAIKHVVTTTTSGSGRTTTTVQPPSVPGNATSGGGN